MDAAAKVTQQSHKTDKLEVPARQTDNSKARDEQDEQAQTEQAQTEQAQQGTLQTRAAEQVKQAIAEAKAQRASIR